MRAQSERNQKIRNEPEALPAAHCTNIFQHCLATLHCIALHWIAFSLRCIALDCNANQCSEVGHRWPTCNAALHCDIAMQHCIAAWHCSCMVACLLACLLARGCIAFQAKVCRWVTGDPPANATLQGHIEMQHCIAALDDNMGLQYCTAESYCSFSLRNCIPALHCSSQKSLNVSRISFDPISFSHIVSDCTDFAASQKHVQIIIVFTAHV